MAVTIGGVSYPSASFFPTRTTAGYHQQHDNATAATSTGGIFVGVETDAESKAQAGGGPGSSAPAAPAQQAQDQGGEKGILLNALG